MPNLDDMEEISRAGRPLAWLERIIPRFESRAAMQSGAPACNIVGCKEPAIRCHRAGVVQDWYCKEHARRLGYCSWCGTTAGDDRYSRFWLGPYDGLCDTCVLMADDA